MTKRNKNREGVTYHQKVKVPFISWFKTLDGSSFTSTSFILLCGSFEKYYCGTSKKVRVP